MQNASARPALPNKFETPRPWGASGLGTKASPPGARRGGRNNNHGRAYSNRTESKLCNAEREIPLALTVGGPINLRRREVPT